MLPGRGEGGLKGVLIGGRASEAADREGPGISWKGLGASWEGLGSSWEDPEASWEGLGARMRAARLRAARTRAARMRDREFSLIPIIPIQIVMADFYEDELEWTNQV